MLVWRPSRRQLKTVRRQAFLDREVTELKEGLAHRVGFRLLWRSPASATFSTSRARGVHTLDIRSKMDQIGYPSMRAH